MLDFVPAVTPSLAQPSQKVASVAAPDARETGHEELWRHRLYISGWAQVIVMIEPRPMAKAKSASARSMKPIKQAGEISTRLATVSVCCQRLPFVRASVERSSPIQKMNLSAQRIRHSQVHLPNVSAKYRVR